MDTIRKHGNQYSILGLQEVSSIGQIHSRPLKEITWYSTDSGWKKAMPVLTGGTELCKHHRVFAVYPGQLGPPSMPV